MNLVVYSPDGLPVCVIAIVAAPWRATLINPVAALKNE